MNETLAKICLRAQDLHEESWDDNKYLTSRAEACELACKEFGQDTLSYPVYLLISHSWNEIQDWSKDNK
jgi:hypothetical protein